jgi:hypothetical protein
MPEVESSADVFGAILKSAIRSYSLRLEVVAINLQNLGRANLRHTDHVKPQHQCGQEKALSFGIHLRSF